MKYSIKIDSYMLKKMFKYLKELVESFCLIIED